MTVVPVTFHGPQVFVAFFQSCISKHKTSVLSALTTTCFPHEWYYKTILAIVVSASATHWKPFWDKWLLNPTIKRAFLFWLSKKLSWYFTHFSSDVKVVQNFATSICMLFIFCGRITSTTIKHIIAVSLFAAQMFFV